MSGSLTLLMDVLATAPLRVHVSLHQPDTADEVAWVPKLLAPAGAFITLVVRDPAGETRFETHPPKIKPKLRPDDDDSYLGLEPGYSYGIVLAVDLPQLAGGAYLLEAGYTNRGYHGTSGRPVGEIALTTESDLFLGE
ncbi:hypothetical protein [Arthrobacter sp. B3I9]|uniref:hypothetical protein n=1 Tax=Arthrobacter sp. B3I9 TaxID=3042270 RepID=UPI0027D89949|nr:hypothetical protein [Arthrobacter sp. B3I9]